jgi:hypothetical protein
MSTLKTNQLTHLSNTGTANVIMDLDGTTTFSNDVTLQDNLNVLNNIDVTGTGTFSSTLTASGNTTVNGQLSVTGNSVSFSGVNQIGVSTGGTAYNVGTNGKGNRTVSTSGPTGTATDGDMWLEIS